MSIVGARSYLRAAVNGAVAGVIVVTIAILCIGVTVLGFINVYGNNAEVRAQAESAACGRHFAAENEIVSELGLDRLGATELLALARNGYH